MEEKEKKGGFRLTIGTKILGSFLFLLLFFIVIALIIFFKGNVIGNEAQNSRDNYRPSKDAVKELILMVTKSKMLITNWVYLQTNQDDKDALRQLQDKEYPVLKKRIKELMPKWESDSQKIWMDSVFIRFERLIGVQKESIMANLQSFDNYEDPLTKLLAEDAIDGQIIPMTRDIVKLLNKVDGEQTKITAKSDIDVIGSIDSLKNYTLVLAAIIVVIGLVSAVVLMRSITQPVNFLKNVVVKLGRGELVEEKQAKFSNDEIGEMAVAMDNLVNGLKATSLFAENIGNGNYNSEFTPLSEHDVLGNALINMRNNLAKVAEDDKRRNWTTEGMAKFGEILRTNNTDLAKLADQIISNLVKYLRANQGAFYIEDDRDDRSDEATMSMKACYAWDKKKFLNNKIHKGEGLAGQAWQEGDVIYLTEVPQDYIKIVSGLGDANPTAILIVPLKVNEQIFGVVEIASFSEIQPFETEFVQKIAESIASTISTVKVNARTQTLLEESQELTEQMRAQEEEMRQNMEELQATQEEMQRSQAETEATMLAIHSSLAVADYATDGTLSKVNSNYLDLMGYSQEEVLGEHHRVFVTREEKGGEDYKQFWRDLSNGYPKKGIFKRLTRKGEVITIRAALSPIKNRNGETVKIMEIAYEIKG